MLENIISSKNLIILLLLVFALLILTCLLKLKKKSIENYSNGTLENVKDISIDEKLKILNYTHMLLQNAPNNAFVPRFNDILVKLYQQACYLRNIDNNKYNIDCSDKNSFIEDGSLYSIYNQIMKMSDICKYENNNSMRICKDFKSTLDFLLVSCILFIENNEKTCPCEYTDNTQTVNKYLGCFKDDADRDLPILFGNTTVEDCGNAAKDNNKQYFGLQNQGGVSGGDGNNIGECWLGDSFGKHGESDSCTKVGYDIWGQTWSNSVYNVETKHDKTAKICKPC